MEKKEVKRPVVFYDLETTGKDKDTSKIRIIQISAHKYEDTENWKEIDKIYYLCNSGDIPIQKGAIEVHGITEEMVKDCPTFNDIAHDVFKFFDGCDVGGYNNSFFDNSVLFHSFLRAGIKWDYRNLKVYDILNLYRKYHNSKLTYVYKRFTGKDLESAHNADADIMGTIEVYKKMKERGEDFEGDELMFYKDRIDLIGDFKTRINEKGEVEPYYGFGSHENESVESVGISYLEWMLRNSHRFPLDTLQVAEKLIEWLEKKYSEEERKGGNKEWYNKIL